MKRYAMLLGWVAAVTTGHLQAAETAPVLAPGDNLVVEVKSRCDDVLECTCQRSASAEVLPRQ